MTRYPTACAVFTVPPDGVGMRRLARAAALLSLALSLFARAPTLGAQKTRTSTVRSHVRAAVAPHRGKTTPPPSETLCIPISYLHTRWPLPPPMSLSEWAHYSAPTEDAHTRHPKEKS